MKSLMQLALGEDWDRLPPSLRAHYQHGQNADIGYLDIEFPRWMTPYLWLLHKFGALLARAGRRLPTRVEKEVVGDRQYWRRTMAFPDGKVIRFDSVWVRSGTNRLIEYVNPIMGLEMAARVRDEELHYEGLRFVLNFGCFQLGLPEWLVLGHTTIIERADTSGGFALDFRLTHPILGQIFRYSGVFSTWRSESPSGDES